MTFFETKGQAGLFLMLLHAGMGAGFFYDLLSPVRRRLPGACAWLADVIWCLASAGLCIAMLALGGEDGFRGYALLGMICGGGIYRMGVRSAAQWVWKRAKRNS